MSPTRPRARARLRASLVALALLVAPAAAAAQEIDVLDALPAETLAVLQVDGVDDFLEDYGETAFGRLWADAALAPARAAVDEGLAALGEAFEERTGVDVLELLGMVHGQATLAVLNGLELTDEQVAAGDTDVRGALALVLDAGEDVDDFADAVDALAELSAEEGGLVLKTEAFDELDVGVLVDPANETTELRYAFVDTLAVFVLREGDTGRDEFADLVEGLRGEGDEGLRSAAGFAGSLAADPAPGVRAYLDLGEAIRRGVALDEAAGIEDMSSEEAADLGLFSLGAASLHWTMGEEGMIQRAEVAFDGGGTIMDVLLAGVGSQSPRLEAYVPAEADACVSVEMHLVDMFDAFLGVLMEEDPDAAREMLAGIEEASEVSGMHPREDFLANLDGHMAYFSRAVDVSEAMPLAPPGTAPTNFAVLLGLSDGEAMRAALDGVVRQQGLHAARQRQEFEGYELYTVPVMPGFLSVTYAVLDDLFVISSAPSLVTDVLRRRANAELPSVARSEDVREAQAAMPATRTFVMYQDASQSMATVPEAFATVPQVVGEEDLPPEVVAFLLEFSEAMAQVDVSTVERYYGGSVAITAFTLDETGIRMDWRGP